MQEKHVPNVPTCRPGPFKKHLTYKKKLLCAPYIHTKRVSIGRQKLECDGEAIITGHSKMDPWLMLSGL